MKTIPGADRRSAWIDRPAVETIRGGLSGSTHGAAGRMLAIPAAWAAIRLISETIATLPVHVYRRTPGGGREEVSGHPVRRMLSTSPAKSMTAVSFRETVTAAALGWGNGISRIFLDRRTGAPNELLPIHTSRVRLPEDLREGEPLRYLIAMGAREDDLVLPADQVLHIPGLSFDGVWGLSPIALFRLQFSAANATDEYGAAFFEGGARPSGVLQMDGTADDEVIERLRAQWRQEHGSAKKSHGLVILEQGLQYQPLAINPEDAQFLETRYFQIRDIARIFRVPPHMIGDLEDATFSNIEHQGIDFVRHTIRPWLVRWEQEINRKLFGPGEEDLYVEHNVEGLLRGDTATRFDAYAIAVTNGWMSRNEVRALENREPVDGLDEYLVPLNMSEAGDDPDEGAAPEEGSSPPDPPASDEPGDRVRSLAPVLADVVEREFDRLARAEADKVARAVKRGDVEAWRSEFYSAAAYLGRWEPVIEPAAQTVARALWSAASDGPYPLSLAETVSAIARRWGVDYADHRLMGEDAWRPVPGLVDEIEERVRRAINA